MSQMRTHSEIINLWPSIGDLASEVGADREAVRLWRKRNRIPLKKLAAVAVAARDRGYNVSLQELSQGLLLAG